MVVLSYSHVFPDLIWSPDGTCKHRFANDKGYGTEGYTGDTTVHRRPITWLNTKADYLTP